MSKRRESVVRQGLLDEGMRLLEAQRRQAEQPDRKPIPGDARKVDGLEQVWTGEAWLPLPVEGGRDATPHEPYTESFPWFQKTTRYVGRCSCGWRGSKRATDADALRTATSHAEAKNGSVDV